MATFDTIPETLVSEDTDYFLIRKNGTAFKINTKTISDKIKADFSNLEARVGELEGATYYDLKNITGVVLEMGKSYYIVGNINLILPTLVGSSTGDRVKLAKAIDSLPTITVADTGTEVVKTTKGEDTIIGYDINSPVEFIVNNNKWEV